MAGRQCGRSAWTVASVVALACASAQDPRPPKIVDVASPSATSEEDEVVAPADPPPPPVPVGCASRRLAPGIPSPDPPALRAALVTTLHALMMLSPLPERWAGEDQPTAAVLPLMESAENGSASELALLVPDIEAVLVNGGHVRVISTQERPGPVHAIHGSDISVVDAGDVVAWGNQVGTQYIVLADICALEPPEPSADYILLLQVLHTDTAAVVYENGATIPARESSP